MLQLKLALRATEVCNIKLSEIHIDHDDILDHYPQMGSHERLEGRKNALYIPPTLNNKVAGVDGRMGNKSQCPKVLPLDDEVRHVLRTYLLARPDADTDWLFLSKSNHHKLGDKDVNRAWKEAFQPEYAETEKYRGITSHFGRHWFTNWFDKEQNWNFRLIQYMRGDVLRMQDGEGDGDQSYSKHGIDHYLHVWFDDVAAHYRDEVFKLYV